MSDLEELLDIKQAARFLKVSETSLRRWTNSGRLACLRVGHRRERRFRRKDLLAFAEEQPTGVLAPADLPRSDGSHLCGLYASDLSRVNLAVAFLAEALQAETVSYLAAEPDARGLIVAHLERRHPSITEDVEAGRLVLTPDAAASAPAPLDVWETSFPAARKAPGHALRVACDPSRGLGQRLR